MRILNKKLIEEWNYEKNRELLPNQVTAFSNRKVWWKCKKEHEWQAMVSNRSRGNGCPYCAGRMPIEGETDLATQASELVKEWNYEKNGELRPNQVTVSSGRKIWWKCEKGHEWQAAVKDRGKGKGCPYCIGKKAIEGETDIAAQAPELVKEWNYEKNGELQPNQVTAFSNRKVWWKCKKGHEWQATINHRSRGSGCPYCAGKKAIEGETDLATQAPELVEEWNYEKNGELQPNQVTVSSGRKVWWKCKAGHEWQATVNHRSRGSGCPHCVGRMVIEGETDIATQAPKLVGEWNYEKNGELKPNQVTAFSNRKVWWKCKKGHEWQAVVNTRSRGNGCPFCAGTVAIEGETDLATLAPKLVVEWNYEKNGELLPNQVTLSSGRKIWWKCRKGHEWLAIVSNRSRGKGCPYCSGNKKNDT